MNRASVAIGSSRSPIRAVPAWSARPAISSRHRPWGQILVPTATERSRSIRPRPCSTCNSTKSPMRAMRCGSAPTIRGSRPARVIGSAMVVPSSSRRARARSAEMAPVSSRDPMQAMPNRPPSSSAKHTTATGRVGCTPCSRSAATAARELATPSGPSKAPPRGTESRWEPATRALPCAGSPHHAHRLPLPSTSTSSPTAWAVASNHSDIDASASVRAKRR